MAFCIQCGNQIKDGAKFCPKCGTKQDNEIPNSPENIDNNDDEELYDVYIKEVDDARKMEVLRELCAVGGYDLAEAGDIVENSGYIKEGVPKEEAEQLKKKFELLGAVVEIDEFEDVTDNEDDDNEDDDIENDETKEESSTDGVFSATSQQPSLFTEEKKSDSDAGSTCLGCAIMIGIAIAVVKFFF